MQLPRWDCDTSQQHNYLAQAASRKSKGPSVGESYWKQIIVVLIFSKSIVSFQCVKLIGNKEFGRVARAIEVWWGSPWETQVSSVSNQENLDLGPMNKDANSAAWQEGIDEF
ncbi:hypothetical protein llap_4713 [Limosa lapponica baueri]|uniref:Uncharacterized protein n=1 Tax=Limosa lapponica baueri TaxID=1758121 RepID=A0A2I0UG19_LIMLA|nr:hypothetical protein llap_4713 [Limosa lapponica baueri]